MKKLINLVTSAAWAMALTLPASAQQSPWHPVPGVYLADPSNAWVPLGTVANPMSVLATFSGTIGTVSVAGFTPNGNVVANAAISSSAVSHLALTGTPAAVVIYNIGTVPVSTSLGASGTVTQTGGDQIPAGGGCGFAMPVSGAFVNAIAVGSSVTGSLIVSQGTGLPTGCWGGGSSGGSGGNVTIIGPLGTQAIAAAVAVTPATSSLWTVAQGGAATSATNGIFIAPTTASVFPISASSLPLPALAATSTKQSDGTQKTQVVDGSNVNLFTSGNPAVVNCNSGCSGSGGGGFTPSSSWSTPLAVTNASATASLPSGFAAGNTLIIYNRGVSPFFWAFGGTATTSNSPLPPNSQIAVVIPSGATQISAITSSTGLAATMNTEIGTGQPSLSGGPNSISAFASNAPTSGVAVGFKGSTGLLVNPTLDSTGGVPVFLEGANVTAAGSSATSAQAIQGVTGGVPMPISGSVTASFSQFAPNGNYATLGVGPSSARVAVPGGATIAVYNTGANAAFVQLGSGSVVATASNDQVAPGGFLCLAVGSNTNIAAIETAGTTNLNISGGAGGCAGSGGGGGSGGSSAPADTTLASTGTMSTSNVFGTGLTVQAWAAGKTVLTGTPTANSALSFTGFTGWNSGTLECTDTVGTSNYEVDKSYTAGIWQRGDVFAAKAYSQTFNLAALTVINVVADNYTSGTLACGLRVSVSIPGPDPSQSPPSGSQSAFANVTGTGLTQIVAAVPGQAIYVTGWDEFVNDATTGSPVWTWSYGTGSNCASGTTAIRSNRNFAKNNGLVGGGGPGQEFTVPPGNALCYNVTTAPTGGALGLDVTYAQR